MSECLACRSLGLVRRIAGCVANADRGDLQGPPPALNRSKRTALPSPIWGADVALLTGAHHAYPRGSHEISLRLSLCLVCIARKPVWSRGQFQPPESTSNQCGVERTRVCATASQTVAAWTRSREHR